MASAVGYIYYQMAVTLLEAMTLTDLMCLLFQLVDPPLLIHLQLVDPPLLIHLQLLDPPFLIHLQLLDSLLL